MDNVRKIPLCDEPEHISEYLTHWTGRNKTPVEAFKTLKIILKTRELLFSPNIVSFPDNKGKVTNQMICFTDTPIKYSKEHCKKYGHFGISFNKSKLVSYGANPVLYLMNNRKTYHSYLNDLSNELSDNLNNEQKLLFNWFGSAMQPYNTTPDDNNHFPEYYEREWRIAGRVLPYEWLAKDVENYGEWHEYQFDGEIRRQNDDSNSRKFFLKFDPIIVENIIVPESYARRARQFLKEQVLGCGLMLI